MVSREELYPKWPAHFPSLGSSDFWAYAEWVKKCYTYKAETGKNLRKVEICPTRGVSYALYLLFGETIWEHPSPEYYLNRIMLAEFVALALEDEGL